MSKNRLVLVSELPPSALCVAVFDLYRDEALGLGVDKENPVHFAVEMTIRGIPREEP